MSRPDPLQLGETPDRLVDTGSQGRETGRAVRSDDPLRLALLLSNAIWQGIHGGDGPMKARPLINGRER